jgi:hypothetical protein
MSYVPELVAAGASLIALGMVLRFLGRRRSRPGGYHVGSRHRRRGAGGTWTYVRPADSELDRPFKRGQVRSNLKPGEKP